MSMILVDLTVGAVSLELANERHLSTIQTKNSKNDQQHQSHSIH
ncbi:hypothetical protein MITS9504_03523 [Synechococcus sp. MIT S9504]|nr:hypothetical protein MITS9504_03523 [Synechococcus sp. MIT S9504]